MKRETAKGQVAADVAFWGGAVPGNLDQLRPLHEAGVVGFKCFLLDSGVPEFPPLDDAGLRAALAELAAFDGLLIAHAEDADVIAAAPEPDRRRATPASSPRGPGGGGDGDRRAGRGGPRHGGAGARRPPGRRRRAADAAPGPRRRRADHRRDLPALPDLRRRAGARRRDVVQVLPADPRGARTARRCGRRWPTATSTSSSATTRRARRTSSGWTSATSARPGAASRRCRWRCRRSGPAPGSGGSGWTRWCAGWPRRRRGWPGCRARGRSRSAGTPTWSRSRPTSGGRSATCEHRNPVTPVRGPRAHRRRPADWLRGQPPTASPHRAACSALAACQSERT